MGLNVRQTWKVLMSEVVVSFILLLKVNISSQQSWDSNRLVHMALAMD